MDADGANLKRLTVGKHDHPAWSPDGTQIAFFNDWYPTEGWYHEG